MRAAASYIENKRDLFRSARWVGQYVFIQQ